MRDVKEPEVRRAEIMEASVKLFTSKGYLNTTTQNIIDEVKISRGLLYYHFKNKEDILYCIIEKYTEPLICHLKQIAYDEQKNAVEKVRQFINITIISDKDITEVNENLQETVNLEENRYIMDRFCHKMCSIIIEYFSHIIDQGNKEGCFNVPHPQETAAFLMTGYTFTANDAKIRCRNKIQLERYISAYKSMLDKILGTDIPIF